jgi:phospholipid/cholesterol/gamma-HCH transport system permease protein
MRVALRQFGLATLHEVGDIALFAGQIFHTLLTTRGNLSPILAQVASITLRSLATVVFAGVFVGAILVLQFQEILSKYDALSFLGGLNTAALVRSIGPLIISFILAGKIGAYIAAELGTMRVTEQIDAIECLGTHPIQYLILPRFIGIVLSSALLLAIGLLVSAAGSMVVAGLVTGMNYLYYAASIPKFISIGTFVGGFFKSVTYGTIVALVACYKGYRTTGGARGVGRAVTEAAIFTNLYIVIANYLTTEILNWAETFGEAFFSFLFGGGLTG